MPGSFATTSRALMLRHAIDKILHRNFYAVKNLQTTIASESTSGDEYQSTAKTGLSGAATGGRSKGEDIGGQVRSIGGVNVQLTAPAVRMTVFPSLLYSGSTVDGIDEAASQGGEAFEGIVNAASQEMTEELSLMLERQICGSGDGAIGRVWTTPGAAATVFFARNDTLAKAGRSGVRDFYRNLTGVFVNALTGTAYADASGSGYQVLSTNPTANAAYGTATLDRAAPAQMLIDAAAAVPVIFVEGTDVANSFGKAIMGLSAYINSAAGWPNLWNVDRTTQNGMASMTFDATTGGALGDFNFHWLDYACTNVYQETGKMPDAVLVDANLRLQLDYGAQSAGTHTNMLTGTMGLVRYDANEARGLNSSGAYLTTPHGKLTLVDHRHARLNTAFLLNTKEKAAMKWISWNGASIAPFMLKANASDGIWARRGNVDQKSAACGIYAQLVVQPRYHARVDNLISEAPVYLPA